MFDIGFWEIIVIAVVALLVVGPKEFPSLVRNIAAGIGRVRRFMTDTKNDLDREFRKMDELKQLMEKETRIAEEHRSRDGAGSRSTPRAPAAAQGDADSAPGEDRSTVESGEQHRGDHPAAGS